MLEPGHAYLSFGRIDNGHVAFKQDVFFLADAAGAQQLYEEYYQADIRAFSSPNRQYDAQTLVPYRSPYADAYALVCGYKYLDYCHAFFRYRNYFVVLFLTPEDRGDGLTYAQMRVVIAAVDAHAAAVLGIPATPPTATPLAP